MIGVAMHCVGLGIAPGKGQVDALVCQEMWVGFCLQQVLCGLSCSSTSVLWTLYEIQDL